ncbi:hypothetical protein EGW08_017420 [Elysia chlorotica]|uniref:acireductone dioxygenase (Fe(2+)-requiring) n=1 Tax=Elysia chlorotica TaxID=188477 RepID=A0A433SZS3_ELYCH|nr:hypothetical protein EGW08_017420 [Elysia chlorotica]
MKMRKGYKFEDEVTLSKGTSEETDKMIEENSREHIHAHEEARMILDGSGYFDVRDVYDQWIRIEARPGDMLVIPAGAYHRFILDENNMLKCKRLFPGCDPVWKAIYRPQADTHDVRKQYIQKHICTDCCSPCC